MLIRINILKLITFSLIILTIVAFSKCARNDNDKKDKLPFYLFGTWGTQLIGFPGYWKNGTWISLPNNFDGYVECIVINNSDIYAGGSNAHRAGYWKNGSWIEIGSSGAYSTFSTIKSITVSDSNVYAAGYNYSGTLAIPLIWINGSCSTLPYVSAGCGAAMGASVSSLWISGTDIYVGGYNSKYWGQCSKLPGYWKNSAWVELTPPDNTLDSEVVSIVVSGTDIYAAGNCGTYSGVIPGYWKNGIWFGMPNTGQVNAFFISDTDIYLGGSSTSKSSPGYWKNGVWTSLEAYGEVTSIFVSGSDIYAGGYTYRITPCYWKNGERVDLPYDGYKAGGVVTSIVVSGDDVYAGGFTLDRIAYWIPYM